ncbi:MAG: cell wall hydrolase [Acetivibrio ethanolgignens]
MQNVYLFLPKRYRTVLGIVAAAMVTLQVLMGVVLFAGGRNEASLSVVYAKSQENFAADAEEITKSTLATAESNTVSKQILLDEQMEAIAAESVAAMQNDLAKETAREENRIQLSQTDKGVLLRIVEAEATGEDVTGKMLVANVILNRVNSDEFPDTVEKVVFQKSGKKYQFSPIRDGRYYKVSVSETTEEAVERVLDGEDYSQGALYFMSRRQANKRNVRWFDQSLTWLLEYGTHEFYK